MNDGTQIIRIRLMITDKKLNPENIEKEKLFSPCSLCLCGKNKLKCNKKNEGGKNASRSNIGL